MITFRLLERWLGYFNTLVALKRILKQLIRCHFWIFVIPIHTVHFFGNQINSNICIALLASSWRAGVCDWQRIGKCINTRVQFRLNQIAFDQLLSNEAWNEYRPLAILQQSTFLMSRCIKPVSRVDLTNHAHSSMQNLKLITFQQSGHQPLYFKRFLDIHNNMEV